MKNCQAIIMQQKIRNKKMACTDMGPAAGFENCNSIWQLCCPKELHYCVSGEVCLASWVIPRWQIVLSL